MDPNEPITFNPIFAERVWGGRQLESLYGDGWQTFISNSGALQYFGSRDQKTAEYFSKLCGMHTVETTSLSKTISNTISDLAKGGSSSKTESEATGTSTTQRPLMFPDELMMMRENKQVVLVENFNPIPARKLPWFQNPELRRLGHNLHTEKRHPAIPVERPLHAPVPDEWRA